MTDDSISRQAAVDALIAQANHEGAYGYIDAKEAEDVLMALPSSPRWIPVTERLPEPNEIERYVRKYYLTQNIHGDMMVAAYHGNESSETWWEQMYAYKPVEDEVIAWMPLPEPWKGEISNEKR